MDSGRAMVPPERESWDDPFIEGTLSEEVYAEWIRWPPGYDYPAGFQRHEMREEYLARRQ